MLYTCCILSLVYIVDHKYLGIQYRYLDNLITTNDFDDGYSEDDEFSDENNVESESSSIHLQMKWIVRKANNIFCF